jgi:hypothetical protein
MRQSPDAVFASKNTGDPKGHRRGVLPSPDLGPDPLHLHDVRDVGGNVFRDALEAGGLSIPVVLRGTLHGLNNLLESPDEWTKRVAEGDIIPSRVQILEGLKVAPRELVHGVMILFNDSIKIV